MPITYKVVLKKDSAPQVAEDHIKQAEDLGATLKERYNPEMHTYSVEVPAENDFIPMCANDPHVAYVEPEGADNFCVISIELHDCERFKAFALMEREEQEQKRGCAPVEMTDFYNAGTPANVIDSHTKLAEDPGGKIKDRYELATFGYSLEVPNDQFISMCVKDEHIDSIEPDSEGTLQ
ncbi:hypothetical protein BCR43DRAFT_539381 [Syncephalastrum racemosum]|uniref:Inhibitor I9 domain-containing protein n=1 Tax=Syncephalastrum racemosum TaxID=13706 RepID=A0A1X2GZL6_SYNRA|nr:hypothetical protein BCR43DRAFT_539381 [Syncephalastrum racemosum]